MLTKIVLSILCAVFVATGTAEAQSLRGTWLSQDPNMVAHIYKNTIRIDYRLVNGSKALYWKGTFRSALHEGQSFKSMPDIVALDDAILGSTAKSKKFTYKNGRLVFQFTMLGSTEKVFLFRR